MLSILQQAPHLSSGEQLYFPEETASLRGEEAAQGGGSVGGRHQASSKEELSAVRASIRNAAGRTGSLVASTRIPTLLPLSSAIGYVSPSVLTTSYCCHPWRPAGPAQTTPPDPHSSLLEGSHPFTPCNSHQSSRPYHQLLRLAVPKLRDQFVIVTVLLCPRIPMQLLFLAY